jgi:hypothetical protein
VSAQRRVHLLHEAESLARLLAIETPSCTHVAMPTDGSGAPFAAFADGNPLDDDWLADLAIPTTRTVAWSGTLGDTLFADEPRTWMRAGHERFAAFCDAVAPSLAANGRTLCFRPHHRHVLGDVHATVKFLRDRAGGPFEALLSPADLLAPSMLATVEDHLERMFRHLGAVATAVVLADVATPARGTPEAESGLLATVPFGEGLLPHARVAELLAECVPPSVPVLLFPANAEQQRALAAI